MRHRLRAPLLLGLACALPGVAHAQFAGVLGAAHGKGGPPISRDQPVTFQADHVEYDRDNGLVTATGRVEAWQNDHVLLADKVVFDRNTNVAAAYGNVVLAEPDGQVLFANYAELTEGMREAVLSGMSALLAENGKLVANGARRTEGKVNELSRAIYSTCNLCKNDPSAAPLWQLRAYSALQDTENKRIEYQDVYLDLYGVPVAYFPYFSHADPSVKRASGFLVPSIGQSTHIGAFATIPYYWVLDDQSDATITPTLASDAGPVLDLQYRRRFNDGRMSLDGSLGFDQSNLQASIFANGQFSYDDTWRYGFDINRASSETYLRDFRFQNLSDVLTSQVYLEGFGVGSYARLDARAYQGLTTSVINSNLPYVLPRYEYSFFGEPDALGGRLSIDTSAFNVYRDVGTKTQRGALSATWQRPFTGTLGELYEVAVHVDSAAYNAVNLNQQPNFASDRDSTLARAQPQVALNFRWPFMRAGGGTQIIEPIAQVIAGPQTGSSRNQDIPNEDSLDFEFSDANLFAWNRYPGIDRLEGGVRVNYALHGAWYIGRTAFDGLVGQSYRFHKDDTFPVGSGLERKLSDIVARVTFIPASWLDVTYRTRVDPNTGHTRMADAIASAGVPILRLTGGYIYDSVDPYNLYLNPGTPASYLTPRNEITLGAATQFGPWKLSGFMRRDIKNNEFVSAGGHGTYENECFIFDVTAFRRYTSIDNDHGSTTILFQITLKTVGQYGFHAS